MNLTCGSDGEMIMAPTLAGSPASQVQTGRSESAFETAFFDYYPRLVSILHRMLGDHRRAEELASDTFAKLAGRRTPVGEDENLGGWLYRTATRLGINSLRAAQRRKRYEGLAAREARAPDTPLDGVLRNERTRMVRAALVRLSPFQARLLILRSHGLAYKELAEALQIKPTSVGTMLARAQAAFEKAFRRVELNGPLRTASGRGEADSGVAPREE